MSHNQYNPGQKVILMLDFHILDENEDFTGEIIPRGAVGVIDEIPDEDDPYCIVRFDDVDDGYYEMHQGILSPCEETP